MPTAEGAGDALSDDAFGRFEPRDAEAPEQWPGLDADGDERTGLLGHPRDRATSGAAAAAAADALTPKERRAAARAAKAEAKRREKAAFAALPPEERKYRAGVRRSLLLMLVITFFSSTSFAVVVPSLWPYIKSLGGAQWYYGWVVAAYSFGQCIASPLFGLWANRRPAREVLIVSLVIGIVGNVLYSVIDNMYAVLGARILVGISAGNVAVARAYASAGTDARNRTAFMANMSAAQTLGIVLGPALGAVLSYVNFTLGSWVVTPTTSPGYVSAVLCLVCALLLIAFRELRREPRLRGDANEKEARVARYLRERPDRRAVVLSIIVFFIVISEFAVLETVTVPITKEHYGMTIMQNGFLFAGAGVLGVITFTLMRPLSRKVSDRAILIAGFAIVTAGFGTLVQVTSAVPYIPLWRYVLGVAIVTIGYALCAAVTYSIYSKVLGPTPQGTMMGLLTAIGSVSRMLGPMWSTALLDALGTWQVWIVAAAFALLGFVFSAASWRCFVPHHLLRDGVVAASASVNGDTLGADDEATAAAIVNVVPPPPSAPSAQTRGPYQAVPADAVVATTSATHSDYGSDADDADLLVRGAPAMRLHLGVQSDERLPRI